MLESDLSPPTFEAKTPTLAFQRSMTSRTRTELDKLGGVFAGLQ